MQATIRKDQMTAMTFRRRSAWWFDESDVDVFMQCLLEKSSLELKNEI